jgi:hypothetical protein
MILLIVAIGALCCMATNTVMIFKLLYTKPAEPVVVQEEKTPEERERERLALEAQRLELDGLKNILEHTGFAWKKGDKSE